MREPRTKLPPISGNTVMLGSVCHPRDNTWQKGGKHSRSPGLLSPRVPHWRRPSRGADVAGDCLSLAQMAEPQLSELKEGVVFPKLLKKFVFLLVGIGQCLFSF